ncbi:MAG: hypothetical protein V1725_08225 [archaeon]
MFNLPRKADVHAYKSCAYLASGQGLSVERRNVRQNRTFATHGIKATNEAINLSDAEELDRAYHIRQ